MLQKADIDLVRKQNRGLFLETLRAHGPCARSDLGKLTGLSLSTITSIGSQLIDEGFVLAIEATSPITIGKRGRPQTLLGLSPHAARVIAVSISVDGVELAVADFNGKICLSTHLRINTFDSTAGAFGPLVVSEIRKFLVKSQTPLRSVARIGVAVQGVADRMNGSIAWSPAFQARNIPIVEPISRLLGVPCSIANNVNMIAEALNAQDRERYAGTTAVVFLGHGIGLGLTLSGQVYSGTNGRAAEFGHMNHMPNGPLCRCGRRGCLEAFSADYGIMRLILDLPEDAFNIHKPVLDSEMQAFEAQAFSGAPSAVMAYHTAGRALGFGIARLIALVNPNRVVFAGVGTRALPLMQDAFDAALEEGLVDDLRKGVEFEMMPLDNDMIVRGTLIESLRHLDRDVFAAGQRLQAAE